MTIDSVLLGRQCKAEVKAARDAEKIRRAALPKEEKTDLPKLIDFLESLLLNIPEGAERAKKAFWIKKYTLGRTPSANPDAMIVAPKYEAWPIGEIPAWIKESFARQTWYWNVLCQPVQHELRLLKAQYAELIRQAILGGLAVEEKKTVAGVEETKLKILKEKPFKALMNTADYAPLKKILKATKDLSLLASALRQEKEIEPNGWSIFNLNLANKVSELRGWEQRMIQGRFETCLKNRGQKKLKFNQGYPRVQEDNFEEGGIDLYFSGQNLVLGSQPIKNSYVRISAPYNPPNHHGPKTGKQRRLREMRKVVIRDGKSGGEFEMDVLFHDYPRNARMKGMKVRARLVGSKLRWFFVPTFEVPAIATAEPSTRIIGGFSTGWSQKDGSLIIGHFYRGSYSPIIYDFDSNRFARRWSQRNPDFPIEATPGGLSDFRSRLGILQRDMKMKMSSLLVAANAIPAGWDKFGKHGMLALMAEACQAGNPLAPLLPEFDAWAKRDRELGLIFTRVSTMVLEKQRLTYFKIARQILAGLTDIGVSKIDVKEMAEAPTEKGKTNIELMITNIQQKNRQSVAPAKLIQTIEYMAEKLGVRVHQIDSHFTRRRCSDPSCFHINPEIGLQRTFTCETCGREWNVGENTSRNIQLLTEECVKTDGKKCDHDGEKVPRARIFDTENEPKARVEAELPKA